MCIILPFVLNFVNSVVICRFINRDKIINSILPRGCILAYKRLVMSQSFCLHTFAMPFMLVGGKMSVNMSKFFTYEERLTPQKCLKEILSFKEISKYLDKNPTTIFREVRKHSSEVATGYPRFPYNSCKSRFTCQKKSLCDKECTRPSNIYCKLCSKCNDNCSDYV